MNHNLYIIIPLAGYVGLWVLASPLFVIYFKAYKISIDLRHTAQMIRKLPSFLAVVTVPVCSFVSFFTTTKVTLVLTHTQLNGAQAFRIGGVALLATVVLDVLITVLGEKIDIRKFPLNFMYLLAYLAIMPAVVVGR